MKNSLIAYLLVALVGVALMSASPKLKTPEPISSITDQNIVYPENVMAIIEAKCMGCHNPEAKNEKAREKLQWAQLPKMETEDLVTKLDVLLEVLEEGSMPPAKMLERMPDKKLTDEETATLVQWTTENLDRLIGD